MTQKTIKTINRIVIGDVGSGKTIVSFLIALSYLKGLSEDGQVALLVPTEVLAGQHHTNLFNFREKLKEQDGDYWFDVIFLASGSSYVNGVRYTKKQFETILKGEHPTEKLKDKVFFVGTHALIFNKYIDPDLVLVDEQHRFGVKQRQALAEDKNQTQPHFISFTATPIPRTLALTFYKTLKPHFLEVLAGRSRIKTTIENFETLEERVLPKIRNVLDKGKKVYVICAKVEDKSEEEKDELWSVKKTVSLLEKHFKDRVLYVHGKMSEKKEILKQFKESEDKDILVATTVVEVGVDVSEATLMVVLNAERFGLAALHQIRGRVGRNNYDDNECVLVTYKKYSRAKRLNYLVELSDGFALAEKDLEIRGSGDFLGNMQSGFGSDVDQVIGLNPELYSKISGLVDQIDFANLDEYPRLKTYLEKTSENIWNE